MRKKSILNHNSELDSKGDGRYVLHIYVNGVVIRKSRGTKRECYQLLAKYGVPVPHSENLGSAKYQSNIYELLDLSQYGKNYIIDGKDTICVVEFELVKTTLFRHKEKRHYYISPIIGLLEVERGIEDGYKVHYKEINPVLMADPYSHYINIPQVVNGEFGYVNVKKTDITLGKFPIDVSSDDFVKFKNTVFNPKFTEKAFDGDSDEDMYKFYWCFMFDKHFVFPKYVMKK